MYLGEPQSFADNTRKVSEMVVRYKKSAPHFTKNYCSPKIFKIFEKVHFTMKGIPGSSGSNSKKWLRYAFGKVNAEGVTCPDF